MSSIIDNFTSLTDNIKLYGDLNNDNSITAADAMDILRYSVNIPVKSKVGKNFENDYSMTETALTQYLQRTEDI